MELGGRISHGTHPLSPMFYVPVDLFIGRKSLSISLLCCCNKKQTSQIWTIATPLIWHSLCNIQAQFIIAKSLPLAWLARTLAFHLGLRLSNHISMSICTSIIVMTCLDITYSCCINLSLLFAVRWLDQFQWFVKFYYWLGAGRCIPAFRRLKGVITNCISERRTKAREQKVGQAKKLLNSNFEHWIAH